MLEAMIQAHFSGAYFGAFASVESIPLVLNASFPTGTAQTVHQAIGITGTNPHSEVYRT
jgi:hypothetical protein